jgi:rhomboid family GlyGly-CTERM serine protease
LRLPFHISGDDNSSTIMGKVILKMLVAASRKFSSCIGSRKFCFRMELATIALTLGCLNLSLLSGTVKTAFIFFPAAVAQGEWWRLLTHSFVHVSWYHLLLDGAAFLLLYADLETQPFFKRLAFVVGGAAGSLLASVWSDPLTGGLCGLSGVAHGLMGVSAMELAVQGKDATLRRAGVICLLFVVGKSLLEAGTGKMLFSFLHCGLMGSPVAVSHAGGLIGSLALWLAFRTRRAQATAGCCGGSFKLPRRYPCKSSVTCA